MECRGQRGVLGGCADFGYHGRLPLQVYVKISVPRGIQLMDILANAI